MLNLIICSTLITLAACTGPTSSKQNPQGLMADNSSNKGLSASDQARSNNDDLAQIYTQAIADYIAEVAKQGLLPLDTLYFGKRNNGQADDFPDITLPEEIKHVKIRLIAPELGKRLQEEKKSRVYINLMGWVEKDKAEFIFVTFSNGFEHKFDCHIDYTFDAARKSYALANARIELFSKK